MTVKGNKTNCFVVINQDDCPPFGWDAETVTEVKAVYNEHCPSFSGEVFTSYRTACAFARRLENRSETDVYFVCGVYCKEFDN